MPNLFLDIETASDMSSEDYLKTLEDVKLGRLSETSEDKGRFWKFKRGALNPFDGKVILITFKINDSYTHRLKEWEDGEAAILKRFYELLSDLQKGYGNDRLKIIGHNILRFDLFFLYNRMKFHKINPEHRLYQYMLNKPDIFDFLQLHLHLNNYNMKGLKHDVLTHAYDLPVKETVGSEESLHYHQHEYQKIIEYSEREFIYAELYKKIISDGLVSRQRLQESISWYNDMHKDQHSITETQ
ncbi:MAG: hypothetical protein OXC46_09355 [Thaumarchaeota archaeon]|nr:hypothetical protein [Nitrososphaerota archaeon]